MGGGYVPQSTCTFNRFESNNSSVIAVLDMTSAHSSSKADSAQRGYMVCDNRQSLVVRDEITPVRNGNVAWFMTTKQIPEIVDNSTVYLTDKMGKKLKIEFASSCNYELSVTDAAALDGYSPSLEGDSSNDGAYRILAMLNTSAYTPFSFTAKLTPDTAVNPHTISTYNTSIASWTLEDSDPIVSIISEANSAILPVGTSFDVDVLAFGASSADVLNLYEVSADGSENGLIMQPYNRYTATMSDEEKYLVAVLCDENGNEITRSERFSLKPAVPVSQKVVWDEDFNDSTVKKSGNSVLFCDSKGKQLKALDGSGATLSAYCKGLSAVDLENCPEIGNGRSIHLVSKESSDTADQAQLNNFNFTLSEGVVVTEMEYLFKDYNTPKILSAIKAMNTDGVEFWVCMPLLSKEGNFTFDTYKMNMELNRPYNIKMVYDTDTGTVICIVDDKYFGSVVCDESLKHTIRYSFQLRCSADTEAYADNFKVTNLIY